jgi:dipeptidyl aminopeptidase/acylaminoacyl peptidase
MKIFIAFFIGLICISVCFGQKNGTIIKRANVEYPEYDKIEGIDFYYTKNAYEKALKNKNIVTEKIYYLSDGLKVVAYLARPAEIENKKLPVIIFNRGSYIRNDIAYVHAPLFEKMIDSGFIVIAPALRQSEGGEGTDELGGKDINDVMNLIPLISSLNYADTAQLFMYGESRGGMMTFMAMRENFPLKAAATVGAFTDLGLFIKDNPGMESVSKKIWVDYKETKEKIFERRSAVNWVKKLNTPLLIMNGNNDYQVKPRHSLNLAERMQVSGKKYQLIIFDGGNHILSGIHTEERDLQIIKWFKKHLH